MIEAGQGQRFFAQALAGSLVGNAAGGEDFEGHVAIEALVARPVDNAHAACAKLFGYKIVPEPVTDHFGSARISLYARRLEGTATTTDQCAADVLFLEDREERPPLKHIARRSYIPTILSILNATLGTRDRHGLPGRSTT